MEDALLEELKEIKKLLQVIVSNKEQDRQNIGNYFQSEYEKGLAHFISTYQISPSIVQFSFEAVDPTERRILKSIQPLSLPF